MKNITQKDIAAMKDADIQKNLKTFREGLKDLNFGFSGKENEASMPRVTIRRTIARLLTELKKRSLSTSEK